METYIISLTSTIVDFIQGDLLEEDIGEAFLMFSCTKEHVFCKELVPMEATWANTSRSKPCGDVGSEVPITMVDEDKRKAVNRFLLLMEQAEKDGRIHWECGNQPALFERLSETCPDAEIYYRRHWHAAGRLLDKS